MCAYFATYRFFYSHVINLIPFQIIQCLGRRPMLSWFHSYRPVKRFKVALNCLDLTHLR